MKNLRKFFILFLLLFLGILAFAPNALAAKELVVVDTNSCQDCTAVVPITLTGGFNDVNGIAFTLTYDSSKFDFVGLAQATTAIDDGSTYDSEDEETWPLPAEVESTIYYQANVNDVAASDIDEILIAAAGANFFASDTSDVTPFRVEFHVKAATALDTYAIGVQQTIIGPDTASSAGYDEDTLIPVATGLAPTADPLTETQTFAVTLTDGSITVSAALKGDVSGDGEITSQDAVDAFYLSFTPWDELTADQQFRADYNGDGQLTAQDAVDIFYAQF